MKSLRTAIFVISFVLFIIFVILNIYALWLQPNRHKFDQGETETARKIADVRSLDELLVPYEDTHKKADAERASAAASSKKLDLSQEPFNSETRLQTAIVE